jgi:hypothetical protein
MEAGAASWRLPASDFHCVRQKPHRHLQSGCLKRKVDLFMETPSPLSICITNMVIVFAVLIVLAFVIQLIHVVDPTKNKKK